MFANVANVCGLVCATRTNKLATCLNRYLFLRLIKIDSVVICFVHKRLLQQHMYAFRIEAFLAGHLEQPAQYVSADLGSARQPCNPETITATGDLDVEAAFDLPQVFIKLAAEVCKAAVIGWLEDYVPRNLDSIQNLYL